MSICMCGQLTLCLLVDQQMHKTILVALIALIRAQSDWMYLVINLWKVGRTAVECVVKQITNLEEIEYINTTTQKATSTFIFQCL